MTSQSKIDIEADAGRLLRRGLAAAGRVVLVDIDLGAGAEWLVKREYARWSSGILYITEPRFDHVGNRMPGPETGREYYERLCQNPSVTASATAWKEEARSGLAVKPGRLGTVTRRSEIDRAVIPSPSPPRTPRSPEDVAGENEGMAAARARWLRQFKCSEDELYRFGHEGRIRWCAGCEDWGIMDRKGEGRFHSRCRNCRKDNHKRRD